MIVHSLAGCPAIYFLNNYISSVINKNNLKDLYKRNSFQAMHFFMDYNKVCNHPQPPKTIRNHPQTTKTTQDHPQPPTTINNHPQLSTVIQKNYPQPSTIIHNHPKITPKRQNLSQTVMLLHFKC